jgi:hypothetical protein
MKKNAAKTAQPQKQHLKSLLCLPVSQKASQFCIVMPRGHEKEKNTME